MAHGARSRVLDSTESAPAPATDDEVVTVELSETITRVVRGSHTIGYVQRVGRVHVALAGRVYNTSIEIAQKLDRESALEALVRS